MVANSDAFPDLAAQLTSYQAKLGTGGYADANALYTLTFGGNGCSRYSGRVPEPAILCQALIQTYVAGVGMLRQLGAKYILVTGLPASAKRRLGSKQRSSRRWAALPRASGTTITSFSLRNFLLRR